MSETENPSPAGANGRNPNGRFAAGNKIGKGNPCAKKAQQLRFALLRAVTVGDLKAIVKALIRKAKEPDLAAAKLLLSYTLGEPIPVDVLEEIDQLKTLVEQLTREPSE